jgi:serine phosphatase RsbU (regulator of sigma subunit)
MVVALRAGRRTIGAMTFVMAESRRRYSESEVELAEELAARAGNAIDNARLYRERARTAATLMAGLRPPAIPRLPGWSCASLYRPAGRADEVGGDFYDVFRVGPGWMLVIGDVIGHGPPAAALTSLARYSIRTAATLSGSPKTALEHLNAELRREGRLALLTAACVLLWDTDEGGCASVTVAGHPRPILVREGRPELVGKTSVVLGVNDDAEYPEDVVRLETGDCLVLYTDGVLDAASATDRFGEERLLSALTGAVASPQAAVDRIETALAVFQTRAQCDDIAILAVQRASVSADIGVGRGHETPRFSRATPG